MTRILARSEPADRDAPGASLNIVVRSVLTAVSLVVVLLPAVVAIGAFVPDLPTVGRFGVLVVTDLPYILNATVGALLLSVLALRLGGGRYTQGLVWLNATVVFGLLVITLSMTAFATRLGVPFSLLRQAVAVHDYPPADERVIFATVEGIDLRADLWRAPPGGGGGSPAIVWIHGGAFISGDLGSRAPLFQDLAAHGIAVIDVEYRLAEPPRWADAPADALCALAWVGAHASELGVDPSRIVVAGESAGASLAMLAGYAAGTGRLSSSCGGTPVRPAGVFAVAPAADLRGIWEDKSIYALERPFPEAYIGGPPGAFPDRYERASPFWLLRDDLPPTYFLTGANDHFVLPPRVIALHDAVVAAGSESTLVVAPFADHGFDGSPNGYGAQLVGVLLRRFVADVTG